MKQMASPVDRLFGWLLDHDGDLYGDEQERMRWYEASAATMSIQTIAVSWVVAVGALLGGRPVAPILTAVLVALYVPTLLSTIYVQRRHVRTVPRQWGRKRIVLTVLMVVPYVIGAFALIRAFGLSSSEYVGLVIGTVVGLVAAGLVLVLRYRKERARELDTADVE